MLVCTCSAAAQSTAGPGKEELSRAAHGERPPQQLWSIQGSNRPALVGLEISHFSLDRRQHRRAAGFWPSPRSGEPQTYAAIDLEGY